MGNYVNDLVKEKLEKIKKQENVYSIGRVSKIKGYILEVSGLDEATYFEEVKIGTNSLGYVNAIFPNYISVAIIKKNNEIHVGDEVIATGREFTAKYSEDSIGKIIDMFGIDKMKEMEFENLESLPLEKHATPIMDRSAVCRPLHTGIVGIDLIYPIGKGQRQLIIGDKKTGKTQIALDTIVSLQNDDVLCIYIAIGKTKKEIREVYYELSRHGAMKNTIILVALNDDEPTVLSWTPYAGLAIADRYLQEKKDVLVVIDDLKRHADAYREICLLSGKMPGREAYPADIFYTHARLLEKGCQKEDGGSITILPIVETKGADITDYISTNIISITDGQIVLSKKNFDKGQKPAIDYGLSVSRLGGAVQTPKLKKLGSKVRRELTSYLEKRDVYELANIDEMSPEMRDMLTRGKTILNCLSQYKFEKKDEDQIIDTFDQVVNK